MENQLFDILLHLYNNEYLFFWNWMTKENQNTKHSIHTGRAEGWIQGVNSETWVWSDFIYSKSASKQIWKWREKGISILEWNECDAQNNCSTYLSHWYEETGAGSCRTHPRDWSEGLQSLGEAHHPNGWGGERWRTGAWDHTHRQVKKRLRIKTVTNCGNQVLPQR